VQHPGVEPTRGWKAAEPVRSRRELIGPQQWIGQDTLQTGLVQMHQLGHGPGDLIARPAHDIEPAGRHARLDLVGRQGRQLARGEHWALPTPGPKPCRLTVDVADDQVARGRHGVCDPIQPRLRIGREADDSRADHQIEGLLVLGGEGWRLAESGASLEGADARSVGIARRLLHHVRAGVERTQGRLTGRQGRFDAAPTRATAKVEDALGVLPACEAAHVAPHPTEVRQAWSAGLSVPTRCVLVELGDRGVGGHEVRAASGDDQRSGEGGLAHLGLTLLFHALHGPAVEAVPGGYVQEGPQGIAPGREGGQGGRAGQEEQERGAGPELGASLLLFTGSRMRVSVGTGQLVPTVPSPRRDRLLPSRPRSAKAGASSAGPGTAGRSIALIGRKRTAWDALRLGPAAAIHLRRRRRPLRPRLDLEGRSSGAGTVGWASRTAMETP